MIRKLGEGHSIQRVLGPAYNSFHSRSAFYACTTKYGAKHSKRKCMLSKDAEERIELPVDTVLGMEMAAPRVEEISEAVDSSANKIATSAQNESRPIPPKKCSVCPPCPLFTYHD